MPVGQIQELPRRTQAVGSAGARSGRASALTLRPPAAPGAALRGAWRALVRLQRDVEATAWGRLLLWNAWPAYVFALPLGAKAWGLARLVTTGLLSGAAADPLRELATVAEQLASTLFLALVVVLFVVRRPVVGRRASWRGGAVALAGTFVLTAAALVPAADAPAPALILASSITAAGTLFSGWALLALGRCFGLFPEARGLVRRGPYRWVRHPVYLGELVAALGLALARPHPAMLALYGVFVGLQVWRAVLEEAALQEAFPTTYPAYRARTGRLLPWWR